MNKKINRRICKEFVKIIIAFALMMGVFLISMELNLSTTFFPVYIGKKFVLWRQIVRYSMYAGLILVEILLGGIIAKCDGRIQYLKRKKRNIRKMQHMKKIQGMGR